MADLVNNETGQLEHIADPAAADAALRAGTHGLNAAAPVHVVGEDGAVVEADAKDAGSLLQSGYRLAHPQEVQGALDQAKFGTAGQQVLTGLEGAASGATMGGSDALAKYAAPEYAGDLAKRAEVNPLSRGIGEGVGIVAPVLLSGGTGAVAGIAKLAPAAIATRAAEAAGAIVKAADTASLATKAVRAVGQFAIEGAVEDALFGASKRVSDDYLRDHEITAERIATGLGSDLLEGLKFNLPLGGAAAVGTIGKEIGAGLIGRLSRSTPGAPVAGAVETTAKASPLSKLDDWTAGATAKERFATQHADAVKTVTDTLDHSAELGDEIRATMNVGFKPDAIHNILTRDPPQMGSGPSFASLQEKALDAKAAMAEQFAAAKADLLTYSEHGARQFKKGQALADALVKNSDDAVAKGGLEGLTDLLTAHDQYKRNLGELQTASTRGGDQAAASWFDDAYHQHRALLEDASLVGGGFAAMQKETNAAYSAYIPYARAFEAETSLGRNMRTRRNKFDGFEMTRDADPKKVGAVLGDVGGPTNYKSEDILRQTPILQAQLAETLSKYYDLGGSRAGSVQALQENALKVSGALDSLKATKAQADGFSSAQQALRDIPLVGDSLAKGKVSAQRAGAAVSSAVQGVGAQSAAARMIHKAAVTAADKAQRLVESTARGLVYAKRAAHVAPGEAAFIGERYNDDQPHKFNDHVDSVLADDGAARGKLRAALWDLRQVAPTMADAQERQAVATAAFLKSKLPQRATQPNDVLQNTRPRPKATATEALKAKRYIDAAVKPENAYKRMKNGNHTPQDLETVKALYPRLYQQLQGEVLDQVSQLKKTPDSDTQRILSDVAGVPISRIANPAYRQQVQQLIQTAPTAAATATQAQGGAPPRGHRQTNLDSQLASQWGGESSSQ